VRKRYELRLPAIAVKQGSKSLYSFAVDGKKLPLFTTISRVHRDEENRIGGYQRPEALAHIRAIKRYLESDDAILPNALVIAFDERVRFEPARVKSGLPEAGFGHLVIPVDEELADEKKPGWLVDGQQRSAAIREADVNGLPVFVTAFITDSVSEQRSQFILVNSTKPLPKGLIHELLPATPESDLPIALLRRRYPALLLERLNYDADSPMKGMVRTPTMIGGTIKDNSVLKMLAASIEDGALYQYFDSDKGGGDAESMVLLLKNFWSAVADWFPTAWRESPRQSRLVHGVGVVSMGAVMDEIAYILREEGIPCQASFAEELALIVENCHWTKGVWRFGGRETRRWNDLQNVAKDVQWLSDRLVRLYRRRREESSRAAA
jgi:DGQHR domain-containing protein